MIYLIVLVMGGLAGATPPNIADVQVDYEIPQKSEAIHTFECSRQRVRIRTVEEYRGGSGSLSLADMLRIRLVDIKLGNRLLSEAQTRAASELFNRYVWLTRVRGMCSPRSVTVEIQGMPAEAWAAYVLSNPRSTRPDPELRMLTIERTGAVSIQ